MPNHQPPTAEAGVEAELVEELEQLSYWSHGDYVEIKITGVSRPDGDADTVEVTFDPPAGSTFTKPMPVPVDPARETEFMALLRTVGANYDTVDELVGARVPANYTDGGWQLQLEPPDRTVGERIHLALQYLGQYAGTTAFALGVGAGALTGAYLGMVMALAEVGASSPILSAVMPTALVVVMTVFIGMGAGMVSLFVLAFLDESFDTDVVPTWIEP